MKVIKYKTTRALVAFVFVIVFFYFLCKWLSSLFDGKSPSYNNKCNLKHAQYIIEEMVRFIFLSLLSLPGVLS